MTQASRPPLPPADPQNEGPNAALKLGLSAGLASVAVALTLVLLKLWALWHTNSLAIAASLADSALDLLMSGGAAVAIIYAARPADEDHAFGHTSAEDLTALAQSVFILTSAGIIAWSAVARLIWGSGEGIGAESEGMVVMVISMVLTCALVAWQGHVAKTTGNKVVAADRLHYLGDLIPAAGAIFALWASKAFGLNQLDAVVALLAAVVMVVGALKIGRGAWDALMDRAADPQIIAGIAALAQSWPGVLGFHDLKTRTSGSRIFVNLHVELDGRQTLRQAHDIGAGLRRAILTAYPQTDVIIHKDVAPLDGEPGT